MSKQVEANSGLVLYGRSSSHFTRVARMFAAEVEVEVSFAVVPNLLSEESSDYGENPALKVPTLRGPENSWFGAANICRELYRRSAHQLAVVWPELVETALLSNAQELVLHCMATEVGLIMHRAAKAEPDNALQRKMRLSLDRSLDWLEQHAEEALSMLPPDRDLSFLEVTLFCLVEHLRFREMADTTRFATLEAFCREYGQRASAQQTPYRFDAS